MDTRLWPGLPLRHTRQHLLLVWNAITPKIAAKTAVERADGRLFAASSGHTIGRRSVVPFTGFETQLP